MSSGPPRLPSFHTLHQNGDGIINVCLIEDNKHMRGSHKYNKPKNETIKAQLPSFPPIDIYCFCMCLCVKKRTHGGPQ